MPNCKKKMKRKTTLKTTEDKTKNKKVSLTDFFFKLKLLCSGPSQKFSVESDCGALGFALISVSTDANVIV